VSLELLIQRLRELHPYMIGLIIEKRNEKAGILKYKDVNDVIEDVKHKYKRKRSRFKGKVLSILGPYSESLRGKLDAEIIEIAIKYNLFECVAHTLGALPSKAAGGRIFEMVTEELLSIALRGSEVRHAFVDWGPLDYIIWRAKPVDWIAGISVKKTLNEKWWPSYEDELSRFRKFMRRVPIRDRQLLVFCGCCKEDIRQRIIDTFEGEGIEIYFFWKRTGWSKKGFEIDDSEHGLPGFVNRIREIAQKL